MNLLFITTWWPFPANNGAKIRIYNLLRQLAKTHTVTLLAFVEPGEASPADREHMLTFCREVEIFPIIEPQLTKFQSLQGYLSPWPRSLVYTYMPQVTERIEEHIRAGHADVIIGSELDNLRYLNDVAGRVPTILEELELTMYYENVRTAASAAQRVRAQMTVSKLESALRTLLKNDTAITVVSDAEATLTRRIAPPGSMVKVIPNGVEKPQPMDANPKPYTLIYPGAVTYKPNYEAVNFFIREVLPLIRAQAPETTFTVTGSTGKIDVSDLAALPGAHFTGYLDSVDAAIANSWATVVPLLSGGGTRLKVLQAMAMGSPVISTSKGAEGLHIRPGENILIANTPTELANAVLSLFDNPQRRSELAAAGRQLIEREYTWDIIGQQLIEVIEQVRRKHINGQQSPTLSA